MTTSSFTRTDSFQSTLAVTPSVSLSFCLCLLNDFSRIQSQMCPQTTKAKARGQQPSRGTGYRSKVKSAVSMSADRV